MTTATRTRSGQCGSLDLAFARRGDRTVLSNRYASTPFGAVRAGYPDASGMAEVQITNPAGGVLGGDCLNMEATLAPGSAATDTNPGRDEGLQGRRSPARTRFFEVRQGRVAGVPPAPSHTLRRFELPADHGVPSSPSRRHADLAWDACAAGRVARGERFGFDSSHQQDEEFSRRGHRK